MIEIIDTNVLVLANNASTQIQHECHENCVDFLVNPGKRFYAVDAGYEIINEYMRNAKMSGSPGVGDAFLKWLWNNHCNQKFCIRVEINVREDSDSTIVYEEIPIISDLRSFDRSDQKFLAVAIALEGNRRIVNASDSDWFNFQDVIESLGVSILQLCEYMRSH